MQNDYFEVEAELRAFLGDGVTSDEQDAIISDRQKWRSLRAEFLVDFRGRGVQLVLLASYNRGEGCASQMLCELCDWASKKRIAITLRPEPVENYAGLGLSKEQLIGWYSKFGFKWINEHLMCRDP